MTGPFSIYNKNNELVGTTQNQRAKLITNDPDLTKIYSDNQQRNGGQFVPVSMHIETASSASTGAFAGSAPQARGQSAGYTASNGWGVTLQDTATNVTRITLTPPSTGNPMADALARRTELDFTKGSGSAKAYTAVGAAIGSDMDYSKGANWKGDVISDPLTKHNSLHGGGFHTDRRGIDLNRAKPQVQALEEAVNHGYVTPNFDQEALMRFEKAGEYKP